MDRRVGVGIWGVGEMGGFDGVFFFLGEGGIFMYVFMYLLCMN